MTTLVLASTSPYRLEVVKRLQLPVVAARPHCDEMPFAHETALETAVRLAETKAMSLQADYPDSLIIGGDQVALLDDQQIGKPKDVAHAVEMLLWMSGRTVIFYSALCLLNAKTGRTQAAVGVTKVTFRPLTEAKIRRYLAAEPDALNCAGAAKSEALGGALILKIESDDPAALIGVPLFQLVTFLENEGLSVLA